MHIIFRSTLVWLALLCSPAAMSADLNEVYQMALNSDPLLREAAANRLASSEASPQARSALLPLITGSYSRGEL